MQFLGYCFFFVFNMELSMSFRLAEIPHSFTRFASNGADLNSLAYWISFFGNDSSFVTAKTSKAAFCPNHSLISSKVALVSSRARTSGSCS